MSSAARLGFCSLAVACFITGRLGAVESSTRGKPTRPVANATSPTTGRPPLARAAAPKLVPASDIAVKFGLKEITGPSDRKLTLADRARRLQLEADSRECLVDGLRFFLGDPVVLRGDTFFVSETDYEKCLIPLLNPSTIRGPLPRAKVVVLDPGHGGADNGTQNPKSGLKEKVFTLDVAQRTKTLLENRGYSVVLTRNADVKVDLAERALIANRAQADLFISIHFNSLFPDTKTTGGEVFTFTRAGQRSDQSRGFGQEDDTENDPVPVNKFDAWNVALAQALHREIITSLKLPDRGHKTKHLGMLRGLTCPAALVESGFLSNDDEARRIATPAYRQKIAETLAAGIERYSSLLESLKPKR